MNDTEHTVHNIVRRAKKEQEHNEHEEKKAPCAWINFYVNRISTLR